MSTRTLALFWLVVSQAICALSLLPWILLFYVAMAALHTPTPEDWLALVAVLGYPPLVLAAAIVAWVLYRRNRLRGAIIATSVPTVAAAAALIWFLTAS
jgi:hypothetical protein